VVHVLLHGLPRVRVHVLGRRVYAAIAMLLLSLRRVGIAASEDPSDLASTTSLNARATRSS
jgi:hypothetical protein